MKKTQQVRVIIGVFVATICESYIMIVTCISHVFQAKSVSFFHCFLFYKSILWVI